MLNDHSFSARFREQAIAFLLDRGFRADLEIGQIYGGANNRVYQLSDHPRKAILKLYFQNPNDSRDRFQTERAFYDFLEQCPIRRAPMTLGWEPELRLGLFEFIPGRKVQPNEINQFLVEEAARFVVELNEFRDTSEAQRIPVASEGCFSIEEHLGCVDRRVARLANIDVNSEIDKKADNFIRAELLPTWQKLREKIKTESRFAHIDTSESLHPNDRCVSPSDFGFHNALLSDNGKLRFLDFEYAGWDDPAKLVCDFFCQPDKPVSTVYWDVFKQYLAKGLGSGESFSERSDLLLPAYQLKWCCIMLNEFLRVDSARRLFATGDPERKATQLAKAERAMASLSKI